MGDALRERLERARAYSESARRRARMYGGVAGLGDGGTSGSLAALRRAPAPGRKLQKIGFIMLWIPEPTGATIAVGGPMILAGRYLDRKYNGATIGDVGRRAGEVAGEIEGVRGSMPAAPG